MSGQLDCGVRMRLCTRIRVTYSSAPRYCVACLLLLGLLVGVLVCPAGFARESVTIVSPNTAQPIRAADAYMRQNAAGNNYGGTATMYVRSSGTGAVRRAVVLFDLSTVPNAGIKSATLTLFATARPTATRTYSANLITSLWNETQVTWTNRLTGIAWGAAGGDYDGTVGNNVPAGTNNTATVTTTSTFVSWTVTTAVRAWYNGAPNYGFLIRDNTETGAQYTTQFAARTNGTVADRPQLMLTFLQNVTNLTSTPGNGSVALSWAYPTPIAGGTILEAYAGVVIVRSTGVPVDKGVAPTDGVAPPALCTAIGAATVVFVGTTANTTFTDNSSDTCGAPANGTMYYYKVFTYDTANNYSSNPTGLPSPRDGSSTFTAETGAMPNPPGTAQAPLWMFATHSTVLAAPGIMPGSQIAVGTDTSQLFDLSTVTGQPLYPAVALGGIVYGRPPVLDAGDASLAQQVAYVADSDNFVYAVNTATGVVSWFVRPGNLTTNLFRGGAAVQVKKYSGAGFTLANDLVVVGTRNGASTTTNSVFGLNGNTGAVYWTHTGAAGATTALDMIISTPMVDYVNNAIWVTSHSNGGAAQPNLWKLSSNAGTTSWNGNCGGTDIDSSPSLTQYADVLFVGTNGGALYAVTPTVAGATACSTMPSYTDGSDGAVNGFPYIANTVSPYTVVYTTDTQVHAVSYNAATKTFTKLWTTTVTFGTCNGTCTLSAPVVSSIAAMVYAGGSDGYLYELSLASGSIVNRAVVDTTSPAVVGDPALDDVNQRVYVSTTAVDQRAFAFAIPY
jgi:Disaggregatase related repeat